MVRLQLYEPRSEPPGTIPAVCMRSFFDRTLSRRHKTHRAWTMAALTIFLTLALVVTLVNTQAGFAVYFNGEQIGSAKSMKEVTAVVTGAEQQLKEILGHDYPLDSAISVSADLGARADDTENLKDAILDGVDGVYKMYVLEVGGKAVGATEDAKALSGILNDILSEYTTPQTTDVRFTDTLAMQTEYVSGDAVKDPAAIKALLEPGNTASAYRLTVESTEVTQRMETVPYDTEKVDDATLYKGDSAVRTEGADGENFITEKTVCINGTARSREVVSTVQTKAPVTEVVAVGTAPRPKTASYGSYIWPTEGVITSGFGPRTGFGSANHQGIDIGGSYGESIVAADGGEVTKAGWYSGYGLLVQIKHDNGDVTYYGHCSEIIVKEGDRVYRGQVIAHMGATGEANGVHCHFEIRKDGIPVNPVKYLP
ncbi:Murein DD-endopeptidase MepM and murein hydrolase activator NlpD, contain LysM domain [Sporobacter termitidis DSM 10068]|uniref:Murein DD-endopeptidase MepM and murein hydrolase activator NlpD, contain LysM domain n=1 Tax=Sporobacter termitidis DSM 10068 TaxID=1123282 RepID=A0A1M5Z4V1_9FIRM|nr:peptidoglycan DD-metalloendopeptidase family protein [Sporobacter termitidis]SHI19305.1 Murein DD-endopeptidase MepM and murein hydrolase activator NlpD, contain LysM domain [Sporobacter termitidis DSM 10068]